MPDENETRVQTLNRSFQLKKWSTFAEAALRGGADTISAVRRADETLKAYCERAGMEVRLGK